mgnify:CR=1 FL=1
MQKAVVIAVCFQIEMPFAIFRTDVTDRINTHDHPHETEKELVKNIPEKQIPIAHHWLILHGRYVCVARKPKCEECGLKPWCKYFLKAKI